jgi:hypothetical protein
MEIEMPFGPCSFCGTNIIVIVPLRQDGIPSIKGEHHRCCVVEVAEKVRAEKAERAAQQH